MHNENIARLREHEPHKLRPYLIEMHDEQMLRTHDREMMRSKPQG